MAKRIQSPSSINTYKQCPRKYYYSYIQNLPTKENIHTIRGKLTHTVLEKFFGLDIRHIDEKKYKEEMVFYLKNLFNAMWTKEKPKMTDIGFTEDEITSYKNETAFMLSNWISSFFTKLDKEILNMPLNQAFNKIKPAEMEKEYIDEEESVRGFIDFVQIEDGLITLMDYKTSKAKDELTPEYKLQLAIYALLYEKHHKKRPHKVGIWFLKDKEVIVDVDEHLLNHALEEIKNMHTNTITNDIENYPRNRCPLCKWSTGQCDFYDYCVNDKR